MDEVGVPMLVSMSQYTNRDKGLNNGVDQYIQLEVHNGGLNGRLNTNTDMKNWYIEKMAFSWTTISQQWMLC